MFSEIMEIVKKESDENTRLMIVSKIINKELFGGKDIIQCTNIPFVLDNEIQIDYENIGMIVNVFSDDRMEFLKVNMVSETLRTVTKDTFKRNAKAFFKNQQNPQYI